MTSSRKFCVNDPNNFCYICGKYCQQLQRRNITDFVKQAYEAYFFQIYNRLNHQLTLESQNRSESEFEGCNLTL
jgi:hypothetical protein